MTQIFSNIPVSEKIRVRALKYPFANMQVGQSIFVEPKDGETIEDAKKRVAGSVQRFRQHADTEYKFAIRATDHPETMLPAIGVWRTE